MKPTLLLVATAFALPLLLTASACHEAGEDPEVHPNLDGTGLALSCEANLTCSKGVCDSATLECVDCLADSDCAVGRCHARDHVCVQCIDDGDCGDGAFCHPTRGVCVGCFDDAQCARDGHAGICHPDKLACVECLSDRDCGGGVCNLATLACVGQCQSDAQCADLNPCSDDRCSDGRCTFTAAPDARNCDDGIACTTRDHCEGVRCIGVRSDACCEPLACKPDQHPVDSDDDGCNDRCECPAEPLCPFGATPIDHDAGGCPEACMCPSGAVIGADGECPCALAVSCDGGLAPSDLDGDGCPDTCAKPCESDCDCQAQGLRPMIACPQACADCGPFLACEAGTCQGRCGPAPDLNCACPKAPDCGPRQTAYDSDNDGCNDACKCLVEGPDGCACPGAIVCDEGSSAVDTDQDGCVDACTCDDPAKLPRPDGSCCPPLECPAGQVPFADGGSDCPNICVCASGATPAFAVPVCPCKELDCPANSTPVDDDRDGCPDTCKCEDDSTPGPAGCAVCLSDCSDQAPPPWRIYVDADGDGCYDTIGECAVGTTAATSANAGCPDFCTPCKPLECPKGARAVDGDDPDRCADQCVCDDGKAAPPEGCGCSDSVQCTPPSVPVDIDRDGCADDCRVPCTTACDCAGDIGAACDCAGCRVASACVDGFCASSCAATGAACLAPASSADQVCGCDAETYASRCDAGSAGIDVAHAGTCDARCVTDSDCGSGEVCERSEDQCGALSADTAATTCVAVPTACLLASDPVCGCDGKTYTNDCERLRAKVGRASRGACGATP